MQNLPIVAEFIRSLVRPTVTWGLTGVVAYLAITGDLDIKTLIALYGPIVGFWFAQRSTSA